MAKCSYCNSSIIFGGVRDGTLRFCNQKCHHAGALVQVAQLVPAEGVQQRVAAVHQGACPKCARVTGAVDVHTSHSVWSAFVVTTWKSTPQISCSPCGKKAKLTAAAGSFFLGWWGIPWGLVLTPIQVTRNLWGVFAPRPSFAPSAQLEQIVRLHLAEELRQAERRGPLPSPLRNG